MKLVIAFFLFFCGMGHVFGEEPKPLKTLILIIATNDQPAYIEMQKIWQAYMNSDPEHFEAYFLRADPTLSSPYAIGPNEITVKTEEGLVPGILNKTILGIKAMESRLNEFDYVIRTNLSSFFSFPNLLKFLNQLPREKCYSGVSMHVIPDSSTFKFINFISGAGIYLSTDLVKLLIKDHAQFEKYKTQFPDDVFLGLFYMLKNIRQLDAQRWDYPTHQVWLDYNHKTEDHAYHLRAKYSYDVRKIMDPYQDELLTLKALLKKYYSNNN